MAKHEFEIEGPLQGYKGNVVRAHDPRYKRYKDNVRDMADLAGVPRKIPKGKEAKITTQICWRQKARIDGKNVYAAIEDAIFKQDRDVIDGHWTREIHTGVELVHVTVEIIP